MDVVLTTAEAVAQFGRSKVRHAVARGMWQQPHRGTVLLHNGPITPLQQELILLTASPPGSCLGGLSALTHDGFGGFGSEQPTLVVPMGSRDPDFAGVETHWSEYLDNRDAYDRRGPRRTRPARSLVDAASWCGNDRYARAMVIAGIQQGLTNTHHLRDALSRRGNCRRRALIIESILDAAGGIQSLPERDFDEIRLAAGLPPPIRQRRVKGKSGHYYLDAQFPDIPLAIEIHGIPHLSVVRWNADLVRANEIVIAGERLLIFSSYTIRHERSTVIDQLQRAAGLRAA